MTSSEINCFLNASTYYSALQLSENFTPNDLKASYKKLALKFHPDKCKDPRCKEAFQRLNEIKNVLSNPAKKRQYDLTIKPRESIKIPQTQHTSWFSGADILHSQENIRKYYEDEEANKMKSKARKNVISKLFTLILLFGAFLIFINAEPNEFKEDKAHISKYISFNTEKSSSFDWTFTSHLYRKKFYVSEKLIDMYEGEKFNNFVDYLCKIADEIYVDQLRSKCSEDRKRHPKKNSRYCSELELL